MRSAEKSQTLRLCVGDALQEKDKLKKEKEEAEAKFKFALVDGRKEQVSHTRPAHVSRSARSEGWLTPNSAVTLHL